MKKDNEIKQNYHKTLNTFFLFETLFYTEYTHKYDSELELIDLFNSDIFVDVEFIYDLFNEIWLYSNSLGETSTAKELNYDVINHSNEDTDHYKLAKEYNYFDIDYVLLQSIKDYVYNILHTYGNKIRIKYLYKNYLFFVKNIEIDRHKINLLISSENFCLN